MFWQSVEELEAQKEMRKVESKEEKMVRKGMQALQNIEEGKKQSKTKAKSKVRQRCHEGAEEEQEPATRRWSKRKRGQCSGRSRTLATKHREGVNTLIAITPEGVNTVEEMQEWEEVEMAVDSGATETVVGEDMIKGVETKEGEAARRGVQYEVASGELIPNLGEKSFLA